MIEYEAVPNTCAIFFELHYSLHSDEASFANKFDRTPLDIAVRDDNSEPVALFLDNGALVNRPDQDGCTALNVASKLGYTNMVENLLGHGAEIEAFGNDGCTRGNLGSGRLI